MLNGLTECQDEAFDLQFIGMQEKPKDVWWSEGANTGERRAVQDELLEKPKLYQQFSSNGHSVNDMKFFAIEAVKGRGSQGVI